MATNNEIDINKDSNDEFETKTVEHAETRGKILADFLLEHKDYTPTIPDAVTEHYLHVAGCSNNQDPRIVKLISLAAQKFVSEIANDALQHCKIRRACNNRSNSSDTKYKLTIDDLTPAIAEFGVIVKKPHYFV